MINKIKSMRRVKTVAIWLPIADCGPFEFLDRFYELTVGDLTVYKAESSPTPPPEQANDDDNSTLVLEENEAYLKSLDPTEWKDHDHYHVLGLQSKRLKATAADIKNAYRQLCLKHHPDKRKLPLDERQSDYFPAIVKSFELLSNPKKRISYDSVDPLFDDSIPKPRNITPENFIHVFTPVFQRNERWSIKKPVPKLGDDNISYDNLMMFYKFWMNFDSWREYSYLDEEEKEKGEDRYERRYLDKLNKAERQRRKNAEIVRIRQLVDLAMTHDPRIKKKREEEVKRKQEEKERKRLAALDRESKTQAKNEAKLKKQEEQRKALEEKTEQEKKEREMLKKEMKTQKKMIRDVCKKYDHFCAADEDIDIKSWWFDGVDSICANLSLDELKTLNEKLKSNSDKENIEKILRDEIIGQNRMVKEKEKAKTETEELSNNLSQLNKKSDSASSSNDWSTEEVQCLVKALQLLPPGTDKRWVAISNFINNHIHNGQAVKTAKQVVNKAKTLQNLGNTENNEMKTQITQKAAETLLAGPNPSSPGASGGDVAPKPEIQSNPTERTADVVIWSAQEQKLLEAALKNYPADTDRRWERIAEAVPGKTKKDCMKRYKEIVELLKAKKAAQTRVSTAK